MSNETDLDRFCAALESADISSVRALLLRAPSCAVAVLPDNWPVFLLQSVYPDAAIIELLVEHGADPNVCNASGETLLHLTGDPAAIRMLVSLGADVDALDHRGQTPMMAHAAYPETGPDAIYTLLAEGADPTVAGPAGGTVLTLLTEGPRHDQLRRALSGDG